MVEAVVEKIIELEFLNCWRQYGRPEQGSPSLLNTARNKHLTSINTGADVIGCDRCTNWFHSSAVCLSLSDQLITCWLYKCRVELVLCLFVLNVAPVALMMVVSPYALKQLILEEQSDLEAWC